MTGKPEIYVCTNLRMSGASCAGQGAHEVLKALRQCARVKDGTVRVAQSVCMGYCGQGPNVKVMGGDFYREQSPGDAEALLDAAIEARKPGPSEKEG